MNTQERTILTVLNESEIEYTRIIEGSDRAFILTHKSIHNRNKIVLLVKGSIDYKMFIWHKEIGEQEVIEYDCMENTWSVFNSLSLVNVIHTN